MVVLRAHLRYTCSFPTHDLASGYNIHICCQSCNDSCWWFFTGSEIEDIVEHLNDYHFGDDVVYVCDLNHDHNEFDNVYDFVVHLLQYRDAV